MEREIKFRAWNGKAMVHGGFCIHATGTLINDMPSISNMTSNSPIMQFTGLKDINEVDCYEGDLVRRSEDLVTLVEWSWADAAFMFSDAYRYSIDDIKHFEIIGNIHEDEELLYSKGK